MRSVFLVVAGLFAATMLAAQVNDTATYRGFRFDSAFYMGAHGIKHVRIARDTFRLTFTQTYSGPAGLGRLRNKALWSNDPAVRWSDSLDARFYDSAALLGFKVIYAPQELRLIQASAWGAEDWYNYRPDSIHAVSFDNIIRGGDPDPAGGVTFDSVYNHHVWGVTVDSAASPRDTLIAGGARFTRYDGVKGTAAGDAFLWTKMRAPGIPTFSDSSDWFDLTLTVTTDAARLDRIDIPPTTVIAYAVLYMRDTTGQTGPGTCPCSFYRAVDTFKVTKERYLDLQRKFGTIQINNSSFRDILFPFKRTGNYFRVAGRTITIPLGPGDVVTAVRAGDTLREARIDEKLILPHGTPRNDTARNGRYCRALYDSLRAGGANSIFPASTIHRFQTAEEAELTYDVYTTRRVPITFRKGAIVSHLYTAVRRGYLDNLIDSTVNVTLDDPALDTMLMRVGVTDEPWLPRYNAYREVASKTQRAMLRRNDSLGKPVDTRGIWSNPVGDHSAFRITSGDLDSTDIRMVHMQASQAYHFGGSIPITYASTTVMRRDGAGNVIEPVSMDSVAIFGFYQMAQKDDTAYVDSIDYCGKIVWGARQHFDTVVHRYIMGNSPHDYNWYTERNQTGYRDFRMQLHDAMDVAYHRYSYLNKAPYPVWGVVQVHGWVGDGGFERHEFTNGWRPTTPEEITGGSWLALGSGVDGLMFSDFTYDGAEFGVMHDKDPNRRSEYDTVSAHHPSYQGPEWVLPYQWLGFTSRFNAVKRVANYFADTILPVYVKLDRPNLRHTHIADVARGCHHHTPLRFVDSAYTEQAHQHDTVVKPFKPTNTFDPPRETYLDVTEFDPGDRLAAERTAGVVYVMVSNTRSWPVDHKKYKDASLQLFDSLARFAPSILANGRKSDTLGLGNIDVRRPVFVLSNRTLAMCDSFLIERIGDTTNRRVKAGTRVKLDWLTPGWGALYKITPIISPVSALGTAYNNAVHSLNPSSDGTAKDRLIVYERDSAVYLRAMDSTGRWGEEQMISLAADTAAVTIGGVQRNTADNIHPAIDMVRTAGGLSCMVVWERRDNSANTSSVQMAWLPFKPTRDVFPAANTIIRERLSTPRAFAQTWMKLTPSVVGVDSGYIVAWAAANYTVEVKAVRDNPTNSRTDTSRVLRVKMPTAPLDSACGYPTLGYRRNWSKLTLNEGIVSAPNDTTNQRKIRSSLPPILPDTTTTYHAAHLAYQQGTRANTDRRIMYNMLGVKFPGPTGGVIPEVWASPTEEVSTNLQGCDFIYPSIGVDSVRVGVTFTRVFSRRNIVLRFRDNRANTSPVLRWNTTAYQWGGVDFRAVGRLILPSGVRDYERSSLTLFPSRDSLGLAGRYEGGLTWQWTNVPNANPGQREHGVKFYRFGQHRADSLPDGQHPTMMLAPFMYSDDERAMASTGVFRRGPTASAFEIQRRSNIFNYYPGYLDNTPAIPNAAFTFTQQTDSIYGDFDIRSESPVWGMYGCLGNGSGIGGGVILRHGIPPAPPDPPSSGTPPSGFPPVTLGGLPPTFFPTDSAAEKPIVSLGDVMNITRTGVFAADTNPVVLTRVFTGNDSLVPWLNTQPYDGTSGGPANIYFTMQVVRASDGAVLWAGDTISARAIGSDTVIQDVSVPVHTAAAPGTPVYVRLGIATTSGMTYTVSGGFRFLEGEPVAALPKPIERRTGSTTERASTAGINVAMIPNPLRGNEGELRIDLRSEGTGTVAVYDLLGNRVMELPEITAKKPGTYAMPVDLGALRNGVYVAEVRMGSERGTARFAVMR